jgi:hypothetical protein
VRGNWRKPLSSPQYTVAPEREEHSGHKSNFRLPDQLDGSPVLRVGGPQCRFSFVNRRSSAALHLPGSGDPHAVRLVTQRDGNVC